MKMSREWAMPSPHTFTIRPIAALLARHLPEDRSKIVDPFCGNSTIAGYRNDLRDGNDAVTFCSNLLRDVGAEWADAVLFDPPYSPRQIAEVYRSVGLSVGMKDTQSACLYRDVRDKLWPLLRPGGVALSFGWNSVGFGKGRGAVIEEILLVSHGGAHNDTICLVERKTKNEVTA